MNRERKDGEYYYAPHRSSWGVWQWHCMDDGFCYGSFMADFRTREDARKEVYKLNNWKWVK